MNALAKRNMPVMVDYDRYGWLEADPARFERTRRRGIVNTFLQRRSYYAVLDYLSHGAPRLPRFLSLSEAVTHFAAELRMPHGALTRDQVRARYVVARYFHAAGREWL